MSLHLHLLNYIFLSASLQTKQIPWIEKTQQITSSFLCQSYLSVGQLSQVKQEKELYHHYIQA